MIKETDIMTDKDVAKLLGLTVMAFQRKMRIGMKKGEFDLLKAQPVVIGNRRWWERKDVERVLTERILVNE